MDVDKRCWRNIWSRSIKGAGNRNKPQEKELVFYQNVQEESKDMGQERILSVPNGTAKISGMNLKERCIAGLPSSENTCFDLDIGEKPTLNKFHHSPISR
jgi:hypothetical protein